MNELFHVLLFFKIEPPSRGGFIILDGTLVVSGTPMSRIGLASMNGGTYGLWLLPSLFPSRPKADFPRRQG